MDVQQHSCKPFPGKRSSRKFEPKHSSSSRYITQLNAENVLDINYLPLLTGFALLKTQPGSTVISIASSMSATTNQGNIEEQDISADATNGIYCLRL